MACCIKAPGPCAADPSVFVPLGYYAYCDISYDDGTVERLIFDERRDGADGDSARADENQRQIRRERVGDPRVEGRLRIADVDDFVGKRRRKARGETPSRVGKGADSKNHSTTAPF